VIGGATVCLEDVMKVTVAFGTVEMACFGRAESGAAFLAVGEGTLAVRKEWG
jgi:hypothetical protein